MGEKTDLQLTALSKSKLRTQAISTLVSFRHPHTDDVYEGSIIIAVRFAPAAVCCKRDKRSTRQLLMERGVSIPARDKFVDMFEVLTRNGSGGEPLDDSAYVVDIVDARASDELINVRTGLPIKGELAKTASSFLVGKLAWTFLTAKHIYDKEYMTSLLI